MLAAAVAVAVTPLKFVFAVDERNAVGPKLVVPAVTVDRA
jgi:hypothetical protein